MLSRLYPVIEDSTKSASYSRCSEILSLGSQLVSWAPSGLRHNMSHSIRRLEVSWQTDSFSYGAVFGNKHRILPTIHEERLPYIPSTAVQHSWSIIRPDRTLAVRVPGCCSAVIVSVPGTESD